MDNGSQGAMNEAGRLFGMRLVAFFLLDCLIMVVALLVCQSLLLSVCGSLFYCVNSVCSVYNQLK
jgi:hypothetical protein